MGAQENKLYVGNLSYEINEEGLNDFFESNGVPVGTVTIIKDKYTDRPKGFGFVEVGSQEEVENAISTMNGKELDGRTIAVSQARAREERRSFSGPRDDRAGRGKRGGRGSGRFGKPRNRY
ncbi:MAG: RNA-binding protein [Thermoplasmata archaeon]|nr:MAG: RNA-binding protein [Thermoplasmata archaeon]